MANMTKALEKDYARLMKKIHDNDKDIKEFQKTINSTQNIYEAKLESIREELTKEFSEGLKEHLTKQPIKSKTYDIYGNVMQHTVQYPTIVIDSLGQVNTDDTEDAKNIKGIEKREPKTSTITKIMKKWKKIIRSQ